MSIKRDRYWVKHSRSSARASAVPTRDVPRAVSVNVGRASGGFSGVCDMCALILAGAQAKRHRQIEWPLRRSPAADHVMQSEHIRSSRIVRVLERVLDAVDGATSVLALRLSLSLFLQWSLRDGLGAYSTVARGTSQISMSL